MIFLIEDWNLNERTKKMKHQSADLATIERIYTRTGLIRLTLKVGYDKGYDVESIDLWGVPAVCVECFELSMKENYLQCQYQYFSLTY